MALLRIRNVKRIIIIVFKPIRVNNIVLCDIRLFEIFNLFFFLI